MRIGAAILMAATCGTVLSAHDGEEHAAGAMSGWDGIVVVLLLVSGIAYARGARHLHGRQSRREPIAFGLGWTVLLIAVLPPLDSLAVTFFSAHMIQHELMMLVGAPLVMAGRPLSTALWGLPVVLRRAAAGTLQAGPIARPWRALTAPVAAWALHGAVVWAWHVPLLYDAAVRNEGIHAVQHAMFVGTSTLFWWGLLYGRYGRAGYGAAVFYVFTTVVHTGLLGAMLTFAGAPLYASYPALEDQQRAGLLMWIPAGIVLTLLGIGLFAAWVGESERRAGTMRSV